MRKPLQLMSAPPPRRTDPLGVTLAVVLGFAACGSWYWLETHAHALPPWLRERLWLAGTGPGMLALLALVSLRVAFGHHGRRGRTPRWSR